MDPFVQGMAAVRLVSSVVELVGALLMVKLNRLDAAVRVNAVLGLIGPLILIVTMSIGLFGLADKLPPGRLFMIFAGVCLILLGTR